MRRAIFALLLIGTAGFLTTPPARPEGNDQLMNGIGLVDYSRRSAVRVGAWTRYHVTGKSDKGTATDYTMTIGIAGEERLWGEECFWVETSTQSKGASSAIATLMSYSVFQDSTPFVHMQYYTRKNIAELDASGQPSEEVARRPPAAIKNRPAAQGQSLAVHFDTLAVETLTVAKGKFVCRHIQIRQNLGVEAERGDSSLYTTTLDQRDSYVSERVPLTGIVREDILFHSTLKTWMAGRSTDAPTNTLGHSTGVATLEDYGDDYKAYIIPANKRRTQKEQDREAAARAAPATAKKSAPAKASTAKKPG